jgi:NitT/TauT family transport system substrate-binding protein
MTRLVVLLLTILLAIPAQAETLRVGKSASTVFSYTLLDLGIEQGKFAAHGLQISPTAFGGGPRLMQAMSGGNIDIGISTGPDLVLVAKGAPIRAVGVLAYRPDELALMARPGAGIDSIANLKGKRVGVTAVASLTGWLTRQISLQQGWGPDGISLVQVANGAPAMALLKTGQIDALTQDTLSCLEAERLGLGHVLLNYGSIEPHFIIQAFFATNDLIANHPDQVRAFLAGWYDTIAWARSHRQDVVTGVAKILGRDPELAGKTYDLLRDDWSQDGRFDPQALTVLAHSFVDLGLVEAPPDMAKLIDTRFLPGAP